MIWIGLMPQVWLTYSELAAYFHISEEESRQGAIKEGWDRMSCPDRLTRVLLPPETADNYVVTYAIAAAKRPDAMIASLRSVLSSSGTRSNALNELPKVKKGGAGM
jgi:hypothetical protein